MQNSSVGSVLGWLWTGIWRSHLASSTATWVCRCPSFGRFTVGGGGGGGAEQLRDRDLEKSPSFQYCSLGMQVSFFWQIHCRFGWEGGECRTIQLVVCWAGYGQGPGEVVQFQALQPGYAGVLLLADSL